MGLPSSVSSFSHSLALCLECSLFFFIPPPFIPLLPFLSPCLFPPTFSTSSLTLLTFTLTSRSFIPTRQAMRTCLFLSSAIALVVLAATTTIADAKETSTKVSSYTVPNDENNTTGYFTLIDRETQHDGTRLCSILDRGETQVFRNLWPANRSGDRLQVLRRNVHDESHHGGSHSHEENVDSKEAKDLFDLNTNSKEWALMEDAFLNNECDQVKDETLNDSIDVDFQGLGSSQQVFENKGSVSGLQEGDEVVRDEPTFVCGNFIHTK